MGRALSVAEGNLQGKASSARSQSVLNIDLTSHSITRNNNNVIVKSQIAEVSSISRPSRFVTLDMQECIS